jgi:hypothetical protein
MRLSDLKMAGLWAASLIRFATRSSSAKATV